VFRRVLFVSTALAFIVVLAVALGAQETVAKKNPAPATPNSIEAGHAIYQKYCQFCHGDSAKGDGRMAPEGSQPADLTTGKFKHGPTDGELYVTINEGIGPKYDMDGFKGKMPDQDIWNVINYIRTLAPKGTSR
jgi:mono/diheme cytochrome c family protein